MARGSAGQARNLLGIAKTLFAWAARQKRFGLGMVFVVILFMVATVAVPTAQSILRNGVVYIGGGNIQTGDIAAVVLCVRELDELLARTHRAPCDLQLTIE